MVSYLNKVAFRILSHTHICCHSQVLISVYHFIAHTLCGSYMTKHLHFTQGIGALAKLQVLDVAGNKMSMFPIEVGC